MPPLALALVLSAAVAHASWNILAHRAGSTGPAFLWWGLLIGGTMWTPVAWLTGGFSDLDWRGFAIGAGVSGVLHLAYMLLLQRGYAVGDLSTVYASARGSGPLLTLIFAVLLLGERPSPLALIGVLIVVVGVVSMGFAGRPVRAATEQPRMRRRRMDPGLFFGLLTGVSIAIYTLWDTFAIRTWEIDPIAYIVGCFLAELPLFTVVIWRRRGELLPTLRGQWKSLLMFGVLSPLSYILVLAAVTMAPVSLVAPLREVSVVLVSLFGVFVYREGRPAARLVASAVVVGGVLLLNA